MYEIIWDCLSEFFMIAQPFSSDSFWSLAITERRVKGVMNCVASHSTVTLGLVFFSFFFAGISERIYNSPVLSHVFKGITCHQETLHVIKCVLSAGCTCRGEMCQQGFTAHVCAAPAAVSISLRRERVKQEAFCRLLKVFIKKW